MFYTGTKQTEGDQIDFTAALLQGTLQSKGVVAIVAPCFDGPQTTSYEVSLALGGRPEQVEALSGALALAAGASTCRVSRWRGRLLVEVPKTEEARKILSARKLADLTPPTSWHVPLGLSTLGRPVWLSLADERTCHVALGGTTRSGKTNLLHWLLSRLLMQNGPHKLQLLLCDPKGFELTPFALARHLVHPPVYQTRDIVQILAWLQQTTLERARSGATTPRILAVIDEVKELVDQAPAVKGNLASLAQVGAGLGVHLLVTTQQPGSKALGDALPNFPARVLGRVASKTLSYGAAGRARSQVDVLLGRGDMLLLSEGGSMIRFQAPLCTGEDLADVPRWERASQIQRLDLPTSLDLADYGAGGVDSRGGWNRKELDLDAVRLAVSYGATASDLNHELGISYERAQRLVAQFGGGEL